MKKGTPRKVTWAEYLAQVAVNQKRQERIDQLERRVLELEAESLGIADASFEVRAEDVHQLADYQRENKRLIEFVQQIADTKSKFAKDARDLLNS